MNEIEKDIMLGMISILNSASDAYYNGKAPIMTDAQFDARLEDLRQLEKETGFVFSNSPTQNVGYKVLTELNEVTHNHPMLSLEKVHTVDEVIKFANNKELVASIKLDGLTASLLYKDGILVSGETRGNGMVGSDITEHIKHFLNVPLRINKKGTYIIDGECLITDKDFAEVNKDGEYKNSRNLASGTLSVLDTSLVAKRKLKFYAWDVIEGGGNKLIDNLNEAEKLGFDVVPKWIATNFDPNNLQDNINFVFDFAKEKGLPCDGVVFKFNNIEYGKSLGATSHHFKNGVAYKRKDDTCETKLIGIDWTMGKTGLLTPTAVFKPVEIDGSIVERASVHNVSILTNLDLHVGDTIEVMKCNMIIPQVFRNVSADEREALGKEPDYIQIPSICPICGGKTEIKQDNESKVLICTNENCKGKLLGKLSHFASKDAMDIEGLSQATLEKFIERGYISSYADIYELKSRFYDELINLEGFGKKSIDKLMDAIEKSKITTLDRFIYSLSIPLIGKTASKDISKYFKGDYDAFENSWNIDAIDYSTIIDGFGEKMNKSFYDWLDNDDNIVELDRLLDIITFKEQERVSNSNSLTGLTFVITGAVEYFANRDEVKKAIEVAGGKVSGSVSAKTNFLVCNNDSNSTKSQKAKSLGVKIITEDELIEMLK